VTARKSKIQLLVRDEAGESFRLQQVESGLAYLQHRPLRLTTNKPLAALGDVLHDGDLAEAILDRLLERGAHFALRGRSYRTRHLNEEDQPTRRAKSSKR